MLPLAHPGWWADRPEPACAQLARGADDPWLLTGNCAHDGDVLATLLADNALLSLVPLLPIMVTVLSLLTYHLAIQPLWH
jgi:hypothetical protein